MSDSFPSLGDLVGVGPRLVDRTRSQLALLRSVAALVPCVGKIVAPRDEEVPPAPVGSENVSVLTVIAADPDPAGDVAGAPASSAAASSTDAAVSTIDAPPATDDAVAAEATGSAEDVPSESSLPIQDYDGLAASQIVPRLATMTPEELRAVGTYEQAHRARRTILNRVAQLLKG